MRFIISILLIAILSFAACLFFPWWSIAIVAFIVTALIPQRSATSFFSGFISLLLLWGGLSFWLSFNNEHILAQKVSLLILKINNPYLLILFTALIGAIVGGFAALTASFLRKRRAANAVY